MRALIDSLIAKLVVVSLRIEHHSRDSHLLRSLIAPLLEGNA